MMSSNKVEAIFDCHGAEAIGKCRKFRAPNVFFEGEAQIPEPETIRAIIITDGEGNRTFQCEALIEYTRSCKHVQDYTKQNVELRCPFINEGDKIKKF